MKAVSPIFLVVVILVVLTLFATTSFAATEAPVGEERVVVSECTAFYRGNGIFGLLGSSITQKIRIPVDLRNYSVEDAEALMKVLLTARAEFGHVEGNTNTKKITSVRIVCPLRDGIVEIAVKRN